MFTGKNLRRLIIPLIIEQILAVTVGMADIIMISAVGENAVSGVSLVDTINILLINIFSALATGGAVVSAQYLGNKDKDKACISANQLLLSTGFISLVIMAIALIGNHGILNLTFGKVNPEVMSSARTYFFITALSYPFLAVYNSCAALFRSMGNSKVSMLTSLWMNVINIAGNAILLYGFHAGVEGVAIPSLVSRFTAAIIMLILIRNQKHPIHIDSKFRLGFYPMMIKRILRIGIPNGLENSMFQIGKILVLGLVAGFGTAAIAANATANIFASFGIIPGSAVGLALITVVGQCVGAGEYQQAKYYTKKLMKIAYIAMILLNGTIFIFCSPIIRAFHFSPATTSMAIVLLSYHCICCSIIWPASFTLPNALRAASDVKFTMIISILSMWLCRIGLSYILGKWLGLGVFGVWIAMTMDWSFRSICFIIRFIRGKWLLNYN